MEIDDVTMRRKFWEAFMFGVNWMFTVKSPDEPDFILWALSWVSIVIGILAIGWKLFRSKID